jgi:hypothetical protein
MSKSKKSGARRAGNPANRTLSNDELRRMAQPTGNANPLNYGKVSISGPGGPRDEGGVILDTTDAIILESMDVATVDQFSKNEELGPAIFMTLNGRVNKKQDYVQIGYLFGTDGAAALITELLAVCSRFGMQAVTDVVDRLITLGKEGNIELAVLKTAMDIAFEEVAAGRTQ